MSKQSYIEAVLEGLRAVSTVDVSLVSQSMGGGNGKHVSSVFGNDACNGTARKKIHVGLLLSIDRRETTAAAMETVCH